MALIRRSGFELGCRVPDVSPPLRDMGAYATTDTSPCGLCVGAGAPGSRPTQPGSIYSGPSILGANLGNAPQWCILVPLCH